MRHNTIHFGKTTVTKTAAPDQMRVEVEKTKRAYKIGKDCSLFRVPEVLDFDDANGIAVFERLDGIEPIHDVVSWGQEYNTLVDQLGKALAIIHRDLTLPSDMLVPLPAELDLPGNQVYFHGDLSVYNVCVGRRWPTIALLDWQMTALFGGQATFGTRYFDLLFFIGNLFYRPTIRYLFGNPVLPVVIKFINAYFKESYFKYDDDEFSFYAENYFAKLRSIRNRLGKRRRVLLPRSEVMIKDFIQLIPRIMDKNEYFNKDSMKRSKA